MSVLIILLTLLASAFGETQEKPFIKKHASEMEHIFHFANVTVFQQKKGYGATYDTFHFFFTVNFQEWGEVFSHLAYGLGNGITKRMEKEGYDLSPTAEDLEDNIKNVNGTGRKYLLELFYEKSFNNLVLSLGLIDSTSYIDTNEYANDEHIQFINPYLVNNPIASLPSYNPGIHLHYKITESLGLSAIYMDNEPDSGNVGAFQLEISVVGLNLRPYYYYVFWWKK